MNGLIEKIAVVLNKEDTLELLKTMEEERAKDPEPLKRTGGKNRITREVCNRCAHVLSEEEELAERCPNCGYPSFSTQEIYE